MKKQNGQPPLKLFFKVFWGQSSVRVIFIDLFVIKTSQRSKNNQLLWPIFPGVSGKIRLTISQQQKFRGEGTFLCGIAHPLKWLCWWVSQAVSEWVSESTAFHHLPNGVSVWNFYRWCVLGIPCRMPKVKVLGQKVKGHGSNKRSFFAIFGFKKNRVTP